MRKIDIMNRLALGVALAGIWSPQGFAQGSKPSSYVDDSSNSIIVTARRVEESVQDVPLTINVVTDKKLKDLNLFNGSDLAAVAPGLTFAPTIPGNTPTLALRGAAKGDAAGRQDPTVQTYMNEAPVTEVLIAEALYDIGQVEVLRGPQGTLRGRPSATGAITVTTKRPDLTRITGGFSAAASTLDEQRIEAALGAPIIKDVLAIRVAGLIDRNDNDGTHSLYSAAAPFQHVNSWRASVRFRPTSTLDINVMYQDFKSTRGTYYQIAGTGYTGPAVPGKGITVGFNGPAISPTDRLSVSDTLAIRDLHHINLIGSAALDIGDSLRVTYVGQYNKTRNVNFGGTNASHVYPIPLPDALTPLGLDGRSQLQTHELRLEHTGGKVVDFGGGLYYEKNTSQNYSDSVTTLGGSFGDPTLSPFFTTSTNYANFNYNKGYLGTINAYYPVDWSNKAIFANATVHITPQTDLFGGARYISYSQTSAANISFAPGVSATGLPKVYCDGIAGNQSGPLGSTELSPFGYFVSPVYPTQCDVTVPKSDILKTAPLTQKENAWVYNASLTHRFTDDVTAYASFGHSWRPQTNNLNLFNNDPRITQFLNTKSETSNNYEIGLKMAFFDRKLTFNIAGFTQAYKNFLYAAANVPYINSSKLPLDVSVTTLAVNADADVKGFDIELGYRASKRFSFSANVNYARGRLSNATIPCNDQNNDGTPDAILPKPADFGFNATTGASIAADSAPVRYCKSNTSMSFSADWKAALQAEYNFPVSDSSNVYVRTLINYTPANPFAPGSNVATPATSFVASAYTLVNLYLGLRSNDGKWDVGGYARNLFNTTEILSRGLNDSAIPADMVKAYPGMGSSTGYRSYGLTPRREFGMTARYNF